jgi:hypothetical protein
MASPSLWVISFERLDLFLQPVWAKIKELPKRTPARRGEPIAQGFERP